MKNVGSHDSAISEHNNISRKVNHLVPTICSKLSGSLHEVPRRNLSLLPLKVWPTLRTVYRNCQQNRLKVHKTETSRRTQSQPASKSPVRSQSARAAPFLYRTRIRRAVAHLGVRASNALPNGKLSGTRSHPGRYLSGPTFVRAGGHPG